MIKVGDFLGSLLAGITDARVQADLEAVRIADFYKDHPLLKNFPIPRIRLPKVELNIPVLVTEVTVENERIRPLIKKNISSLEQKLATVMIDALEKCKVSLKKLETAKVRSGIEDKLLEIALENNKLISIDKISNELSNITVKLIKEFPSTKDRISDKEMPQLVSGIRDQFKLELTNVLAIAPVIGISPLTNEVKEAGEAQFLTTFNLVLEEDALVWSLIDSEGKEENVLLPE